MIITFLFFTGPSYPQPQSRGLDSELRPSSRRVLAPAMARPPPASGLTTATDRAHLVTLTMGHVSSIRVITW